MKQNYLTRQLTLSADIEELPRLEAFLDKICNDYHVYDEYYGSIMATGPTMFELWLEHEKREDELFDLLFISNAQGLFFAIRPGSTFLTLAALFDRKENVDEDQPKDMDSIMMVRLLSDDIELQADQERITVGFFITGINQSLTNQRIELLEKYFSSLVKTKNV
ncbi:MAG: hypothetical protein R6U62_04630 [Bacteroidales bacterium]